jgi:AraC family transcriptional regulator
MTAKISHFENLLDFYESTYGSFIKRATRLSCVSLIEADQTAGDWSDRPTPDLVLGRIAEGRRGFSCDIGAGRFGGNMARDQTILVSPFIYTSIQCAGPHRVQMLALPYARLKQILGDDLCLPEDGDFGALHTGTLANPIFGQTIGALFRVADPDAPAANLFFETAIVSLMAGLMMESSRPRLPTIQRGGLAEWQVRRASEALTEGQVRIDLATLAKSVGLSAFHFARAFKQSTGMPPHRYQIMQRIERAKNLLVDTGLPISDVAAAVGYEDQGQLARLFRREVGVTPSQYRRERRR